MPFDTYVLTEDSEDGYTLVSISDPVTLDAENLTGSFNVVNEVDQPTALELTFDDIENAPVYDPESVSDWNMFFDLPTFGTPFSSVQVIGNLVKLFGGSDIIIKDGLFYSQYYLIKFIDSAGCISKTNYASFRGAFSLTEFYSVSVTEVLLESFEQCYSLNKFSTPSLLKMGETTGLNYVFSNTLGNTIEMVIPSDLMTCKGGLPDEDIQYLIYYNTVTIYNPSGVQIYPTD